MKQFTVSLNTPKKVQFFQTDNPSVIVTLTEAVKPVKVAGHTTHVVAGEIAVRTLVEGKACPNSCPAEFPALISLRYSAPMGTDITKLYALLANRAAAKAKVLTPGLDAAPFSADI